ncbi:MAG: hypothetical protein AAB316_08185 [Bacteroidota bacterium]
MKNVLLLSRLALAFAACQHSDDDQVSNPNTAIPTGSQWKVTYFFDKDEDETSDFSGYTFEFKSGGVFVANVPGGGTVEGTWQQTSSKLILVIPGTKPLEELNDDWLILEKNDDTIKLRDDNDEHLEELHFERI